VLFYTDGLVEAHNPQGEMFGTPRLRSLLSKHSEGGRSLSAALLEELERFTGEGWKQEDDVTLLTLERSPTIR
jgi:serine phosphatase RsbU (regulator of sigma subunit)